MSKAYAICRVEKRHDLKQVGRSEGHNLRAYDTAHVDAKAPRPTILFGTKGLTTQLKTTLPEKRRKDAVLAFEVFLGASPEWFALQSPEKIQAWAESNVAWLKTRFGHHLMQVVLHTDEQTPHLHAYCHPVHADGSLSYFKMLGTPKLMSDLQTDYAMAMKPMGLRRGLRKSTATHEDTKRWRAEQARGISLPGITEADIPKATLADRMNPEAYVKTALDGFMRKVKRQLSKTLKSAAANDKTHKLNQELDARLGELEARHEAESTRAAVYRKMLAGMIGFEPDIDTLQGQAEALAAVKSVRRALGKDRPSKAAKPPASLPSRPQPPRPGKGT